MGVKIGPTAFAFIKELDEIRIKKAEKQTAAATRDARIQRKEGQDAEEMDYEVTFGLLYGPGIAD